MQIQCPECDNAMSVGGIKPGRYQPKCKKCGKPFVVVVVDGDPPKIKVGKVPVATSKPVEAKPVEDRPAQPTVRTAAKAKAPAAIAAMDATVDPSLSSGTVVNASKSVVRKSKESTLADATMAADATSPSLATATKPGSVAAVGGSRAIASADLSAHKSAMPNESLPVDADVPEKLGGYRIVRLLGRGAMGAVYEAKQVSLDRNVALKTIRGRLANSPSALARFTREAYAAAQLVHHNVVQIYDFGQDSGQHFFSMEWVRGGPLSDIVRDKGPVDPRVAATYALQAARGLQFAHRHGMVHRDVKPANLLLNDEGVVKVADLGLVKVPDQPDPESDVGVASASSGLASGTQVTMMGTAVGTPAYMAPEQGVDATTVDHRADIYSLGCSLFYFLTGKAPFEGSQVSEVMKKHAQAPVPKVQAINARVPEQLSKVIERSMAKRPEDRYSTLAEMISDLEHFLGLQSGQGFSPSAQQADRWEELAKAYAAVPLTKMQTPAVVGFLAFALLMLLVSPFFGLGYLLLAPTLLVTAFAVGIGLGSSGGRSVVGTQLRSWIGSLSWFDIAVGAFVCLVVILVSALIGLLPGLLIGMVLGAVAGAAYHFALMVPLRKSREATTSEAEKFVRDLRIEGIDEVKIRDFAARYSGKQWKPLFEAIFGYAAMNAARSLLLADPVAKTTAGGRTIRDWVCTSLQSKSDANRVARDHSRLAKIEEQGLKSEGVTAAEAKERAYQMAAAMMDAAKLAPVSQSPTSDPKAEADQRRQRMKSMLAEARSGKYAKKRDRLAPLRLAFSGKMRLLVGCALLAIAGMWVYNNEVFSTETIQSLRDTASLDIDGIKGAAQKAISTAAENKELPLLLGTSGWAVAIAGFLMAGSSFISGWRMSVFAIPAIIIAIFGPSFGIPDVGAIPSWVIACAAALVVMIPGIFFGESRQVDY